MPVNAAAVPDVYFYGESPALEVDQSGYASDWLDGGTYAYLDGSATDYVILESTRTVDVIIDTDGTDTGALFAHLTSADSQTHVLDMAVSGTLRLIVNGSTITSFAIPGWTEERYVISCASEPNPLTTGAGNAIRTDVRIYAVTSEEWSGFTALHAAFQDSSSGTYVFGAVTEAGASTWSGDLTTARLSAAYHSPAETAETFAAQSSAPTIEGDSRLEQPVPDRSQVSVAGDGHLAGPVLAMAARAQIQAHGRLLSPIINEVLVTGFSDEIPSNYYAPAPGRPGAQLLFPYLWRRIVPPMCDRVFVELQIQNGSGSGGPYDLTAIVYAMTQPGPLSVPPQSPNTFSYRSTGVSTGAIDDGTADVGGQWYSMQPLEVVRDLRGYTYFALAIDSNTLNRWRLRAISITPILEAI